MPYNPSETEVHAAILAGLAMAGPNSPIEDGTPYIVRPNDCTLQSLEQLLPSPSHIRRSVTIHDPDSLIAYVNNFREPGTAIFFNEPERAFTAILDYHEGVGDFVYGAGPDTAPAPEPHWCEHVATYTVRETPEWAAWRGNSGSRMAQAAFAVFIEDHVQDVVSDYGDLLQTIALSLEVKKNVSFNSSQRLQNGSTELLYAEDVSGTTRSGAMLIPATFSIVLPPFIGGLPKVFDCRFRYRLQDRALVLWYELVRPEKVVEEALAEIRNRVAEGTNVFILAGEA